MFNALNRYLSRLDGESRPQQSQETHGFGFQILRNTNLEFPVEPWFDFIVGINGRVIDNPDPRLFAQEVRNCAGSSVALGLWSAKGQRTRVLHVPVPADTRSLGLSLQWTPLAVASNVWHVLDVPANSPADHAGLLPYSDYVLGTPDGVLHGESGLGELVDDYIGRPLKLWVYNHEYDVTRELEIVPSRDWGGEGALGCVLGYGALHRLPAPLSEPVHAPGETLFDGDGADQHFTNQLTAPFPPNTNTNNNSDPAPLFIPAASPDFLVPAQLVNSTSTPPPPPPLVGAAPPPRGKKKSAHGGNAPKLRLMDDYFAEEERRSKELDGNIAASKTPPPPPPKVGGGAGGPPRAAAVAPPPPPKAAEEEKKKTTTSTGSGGGEGEGEGEGEGDDGVD
ncbi:GRASP55/65 PDZ-like domain-containing protein [Hypoxylon fragiforme]|uniref:GRASP55/65 PDZ-like domain-containing protein n=1 Tax=Hypoxylon fragiforme TaxID=63214 RepID=UPI0020C6D7A1|nr:GRASP55/65 PDZ-like domain-containing protein [Hypoxylon fragiforme]KAI2614693.1 GRASP55/65 PDZ-like domain-containing protein [Hypoxylon fragiforme]